MTAEKRISDRPYENHTPERSCPIHCSDSRETIKEDIVEIKGGTVLMWSAIGKKVSYVVFMIALTIVSSIIGYVYSRQNSNFDQHGMMATQPQVTMIETRLNTRMDKMEDNLVYEIREIKRSIKK